MTVLVATTQAYIAPNERQSRTIDVGTGTILVHAGASASSSAIADAGNVKFSPDAPTLSGFARAARSPTRRPTTTP